MNDLQVYQSVTPFASSRKWRISIEGPWGGGVQSFNFGRLLTRCIFVSSMNLKTRHGKVQEIPFINHISNGIMFDFII